MKQPNWTGAQRVDLSHFLFSVRGFPKEVQRNFIRSAFGAGLLDGFRVRVVSQVGANIGSIDILNGRGFDHTGKFVNAVTGTNAQRVNLGASSTEYWIEIEVFGFGSDADQQAFWDSTVDNTDPIPDGQEIQIARAFTRQTLFWRVVRPIRQNAALDRTNPAYAPARFSDSDSVRFPVAIIRTNPSGQILAGNPATDPYGNDLISVTTAAGVEQYIQVPGSSEGQNTSLAGQPFVFGVRRSDARMKLYEPLPFPFLYGASGELASGSRSFEWIRDEKSKYDALWTAIAELKLGAVASGGSSSLGQYHDGEVVTLDQDYNYIDVKLYNNPVSTPPTFPVFNADDLINTAIQIRGGHWAGFYAFVHGSDATAADVTRLYLRRLSSIPEWKSFPVAGDALRVIQFRQVDGFAAPQPLTANRGINALDEEVFRARTDVNNGKTHTALRNRLDAMRFPIATFSPVDTVDPTTGNPTNFEPADWFLSIAEMQNAMQLVAATRGGGSVHFRKGVYIFDSLIPGDTVFTLSGVGGLTISGEGTSTTFLDFGRADNTQGIHRLFDLDGCSDITFKDLSFRGIGEIFRMSACSNIRFINCTFDGIFWTDGSGANGGLTTPTLRLGAITELFIDNCSFTVAGQGILATTMTRCKFRDSFIKTRDTQTQNVNMILATDVKHSEFKGLHFAGTVTTSVFECTNFLESKFHYNHMQVDLSSTSKGMWTCSSFATRSDIVHNTFLQNPDIGGFSSCQFGILLQGAGACAIEHNTISECCDRGIVIHGWFFSVTGTALECSVSDNYIKLSGTSGTKIGIDVSESSDSIVARNRIFSGVYGIVYRGAQSLEIANNKTKGTAHCFTSLAVDITTSPSQRFKFCSITGNVGIDHGTFGMDLREGDRSHVSGNKSHSTTGSPATDPFNVNTSTWIRGGHGITASSHPWPGDGTNNNEVYPYNTSEGGT